MFDDDDDSVASSSASDVQVVDSLMQYGECKAILVSSLEKRRKRQCVICRWENRDCKPYMCPNTQLSCWNKFHEFYLPQKLFNLRGNIARASALYQGRNSGLKF